MHLFPEFLSFVAEAPSETALNKLTFRQVTRQLVSYDLEKEDVSQMSTHHKYGILSPVSADNSVINLANKNDNPYATFNPISGQIVWNKPLPVCFV